MVQALMHSISEPSFNIIFIFLQQYIPLFYYTRAVADPDSDSCLKDVAILRLYSVQE
jgi:hypothetical protein